MWCAEAGQEGAEQHRVTAGATSHTDRMQGVGGRHRVGSRKSKSEVTEAEKGAGQEQCRKGPGMTRPPPKTTTTTQHQTAGGRRGRGSNEELKEKQNKVKLTAVNTMNQILQESGVRKREI